MRANSRSIASALYLSSMSEPVTSGASGIYLGKTSTYKLPFYLDQSSLINPHMAIIGTSGSGKSYMLKAIVTKCAMTMGAKVLVIDWNDEYREMIAFLCGKTLNFGKDFRINIMDTYSSNVNGVSNILEIMENLINLDKAQKSEIHDHLIDLFKTSKNPNLSSLISKMSSNQILSRRLLQLEGNPFFADQTEFDVNMVLEGIYSINLSTLRDSSQRGELVRFILKLVIDRMHKMPIESATGRIIVMDEAWRLIKNSDEVGTLYREGRKYGISVISATQMASDINNEIIANAGCIAIFRLQSEDDYRILENAGLFDSNAKLRIGGLGTGSCMLLLAYKGDSQSQSKFYIDRISGIEFGNMFFTGARMRKSVSYRKFLETTEIMVPILIKEKIVSFVLQNGKNVDLSAFVRFLGSLEVDRTTSICYLRELGIEDINIVKAYENA